MKKVLAYFSRQSHNKLLAIGYLMVVVIFGLDYVTGVEFTFSIFYLIAIFFVAWFVGKSAGTVISLVSAAAWLLAVPWRQAGQETCQRFVMVPITNPTPSAISREVKGLRAMVASASRVAA